MADKIYQFEDDGKNRLIQAPNESAALLFAIGGKFKIKAANAVDTAKMLGEGVALEVMPNTRTPRKPRGSKNDEQATAPAESQTATQDSLLNPAPEEMKPSQENAQNQE